VALFSTVALLPGVALAGQAHQPPPLPTGGSFQTGTGSLSATANSLTVKQTSQRAIINFNQFSVGKGNAVSFQNGAGATLARVTGGSLTQILGNLKATGTLFLINPAGVVVDSSGVVVTNGTFVASTHDVVDSAFTAGGTLLFKGDSTAAVTNNGSITSANGSVFLIARSVTNNGVITASQGTVGLEAGDAVLLQDSGEGDHVFIQASDDGHTGDATNAGAITAAQAELQANGGNVYALAVNGGGTIRATGTEVRDGHVWLSATGTAAAPAQVVANGTITAQNADGSGGTISIKAVGPTTAGQPLASVQVGGKIDASGTTGGAITVTGPQIGLVTGAALTVSGTKGGGTILVGGDLHGGQGTTRFSKTALTNAQLVTVEQGVTLAADATKSGSGGNVVVWSDQQTNFAGQISAQGAGTGAGGFAEVSGKGVLNFTGGVNLLSASGAAGTLLLDPTDVTISTSATTTGFNSASGTYSSSNNATTSNLNVTNLLTLLGTTNVIVTTSSSGSGPNGGSIDVQNSIAYTGSTARSLTLTANTSITLETGVSISSSNAALAVTLNSNAVNGGAGSVQLMSGSSISSDGGNIQLGSATYGAIGTSAGTTYNRGVYMIGASINAGTGNITIAGTGLNTGSTSNGVEINSSTLQTSGGTISITGTGGAASSDGVVLANGTVIKAGTGAISITGVGGSGGYGIYGDTSTGTVTLGATGDSAPVTLIANTMDLAASANFAFAVKTTGTATVTTDTAGAAINVGTAADTAALELPETVLADFAVGTLQLGTNGSSGSGALTVTNPVNASGAGTLTLEGHGAIGESAGATLTAGILSVHGDSTVSLAPTGSNAIAALGAVTATSGFTLTDTGALSIGGAVSGSKVSIETTGGTLTLASGGSVAGTAAGYSVTLATDGAFTNAAGAGAVTTGSGNFLIYSADPRNDTQDGLAGTNIYGQTYTATPGTYSVAGNLYLHTVVPTLTLSATSTITYGNAAPTLAQSFTGLIAGDLVATATSGTAVLSTTVTSTTNVGTYSVSVGLGTVTSPTGYALTVAAGSVTVTQRPLTLTVSGASRVYGAINPTFGYAITGLVNGDLFLQSPSFSTTTGTTTSVGTYTNDIVATAGSAGANYTIASYVAGTMTVTQAPLSVMADNFVRTYGLSNPTFTATVVGATGGDSSALLVSELGLTSAATTASSVNTYAITAGSTTTGRLANYTVSVVPGVLTVTQAALTVLAATTTRSYGDSNPTLGATLTGLTGADQSSTIIGLLNLSTSATTASPVGFYSIVAGNTTLTNYTVNFTGAQLVVTARPLTLVAGSYSRTYGAADPTLTYSETGLVNGDTLLVQPTLTLTSTLLPSSGVATYTGAVGISGAIANHNYAVTYQTGNVTVVPAALTVTANSVTQFYGSSTGALTAAFNGVTGGDSTSALTAALGLVSNVTTTSNVASTYSITATSTTGGVLNNYSVSFTAGALTVTRAPLAVTVNALTQVYGTGVPTLSATIVGATGANSSSSLLTALALSASSVTSATTVGTYAITVGNTTTGVFTNYTVTLTNASVVVSQRPITLTADGFSRVYGGSDPSYAYVASNFLGGDTLISQPTLVAVTTTSSNVGTYAGALHISGGSVGSNYTISSYVAAGVTITPAALTVNVVNASRFYGAINPSFTAGLVGVTGGDTSTTLLGELALTSVATASSASTTYSITPTSLTVGQLSNYTITVNAGILTVAGAALTVSIDAKSRLYGAADPSFTASVQGVTGGDSVASLLAALSLTANTSTVTSVGTYAIAPPSLSNGPLANYAVTVNSANLTITPAPLTIVLASATRFYGDSLISYAAAMTGVTGADTSAGLLTNLQLSSIAISSSATGVYQIFTGSLANGQLANYLVNYTGNLLTVTPRPLTIIAGDASRIYGGTDPAYTFTVANIASFDTQATALLANPGLSATVTTSTNVGTYAITATGGIASANYTITSYVAGNLTVQQAPLTVFIDSKNVIYNTAIPGLTATFSGNVESASTLTAALALSTTAVSGSNVGTYGITPGTTSAPIFSNYIVSVVPGFIYVIPQTITISGTWGTSGSNTPSLVVGVADVTRAYGSPNPASFSATITGVPGTDTSVNILGHLSLTTTATTSSNVGIYSIYSAANFATDSVLQNYAIDFTSGSLTVTPLAVTVTANSLSRVYGSVKFSSFGYSVTGTINGDTLLNAPAFSITNTTISSTPVGTVTGAVQLSGGGGGNYTIVSYVPGNLVITQAPLTVQVSPQSRYYGGANPSFTALLVGVTGGDSTSALWTDLGLTTTAVSTSNVGVYAITDTSLVANGLANYAVTFNGANLTVKAAPLTLDIGSATTTYGAPTPSYSTVLIGTTGGDQDTTLLSALGVVTSETSTSGVGVYFITPTAITGGALNNYVLTINSGQITVDARTLTVTVSNASRVYGANDPSFSFGTSGFVNGDGLSTQPTLSASTTTNANVGTYTGDIVATGAYAGANYSIAYVPGTLTITQAALSVTANSYTRFYGDTNPSFGAQFTGITGADTIASLTSALGLTTTAGTTTGIGTAAITAAGLLSNYTVTFTAGVLSITPRPLTITAGDASHVYGSPLPSLTYTDTGLVNGDTLTVLPTLSATHSSSANAGVYVGDIIASGASAGTNYTVPTYIAGAMTVTQASLTVTIDSTSRLFGAVNPTFTASLNGLVNSDTAGTLTTALALGSTAGTSSNVASYAITAGGTLANYSLTVVPGTLTVNPAPLVLTEVGQTLVYGNVVLPIGGSVSGVTGGNTSSQLLSLLALSTTADDNSGVGTYGILTASPTLAGLSNYTISINSANVVITPAALTIDVDNKTRLFGGTNPVFTAGFTGVAGNDTPTGLLSDLALTAAVVSSTGVGTYAIDSNTISAGQLANYTITIHTGILSITPALLTVAVNPATRLYGALNPSLTATVTGATGGDSNATVAASLSLTTSATTVSPVGNYAILSTNLTGGALANYSIFFAGNSLSVTPAPLTVAGLSYSRAYGAVDPTFGATITGATANDSTATMLTALLLSAGTTSNSSVGTYSITAGQTQAGIFSNYTVTFTPGHLTIIPAVLNIIGNNATRLYGSADPSFTASLSGVAGGDLSAALLSSLSFNAGDISSTGVSTRSIVIGNTTSGVIGNYTIGTYTPGTLTINPAPLTVSAVTSTLVYGSVAARSFNATFSGLTGGDTSAILLPYLALNSAATNLDPIGSSYTIVAGSTTAMGLANYTITFNNAPLTITPAPLTITGASYSRLYYTANPASFDATITGVTGNENSNELLLDLALQTTASQASNVGTYAITGVTTSSDFHNYTVNFTHGNLTITPQPLTVVGADASRIYGGAEVGPYAATVTFATGADTTAALLSALFLSPGTSSSSNVGTYAINITGALTSSPLQNYAITITPGILTITPAALSIGVGNYSRTYGGINPTYTASLTGVTGGDSLASLITSLALTAQTSSSTNVGTATSVGTYTIVEGSTTSGRLSNYMISTYTAGNLTIGQAPLTVMATNNTQYYGIGPSYSLTFTGVTGGDTTAILSAAVSPTYTLTAPTQPPVGTYAIGLTGNTTGGQLNNYTVTLDGGSFVVTPRPLTITAGSQTLTYNGLTSAGATFGVTYSSSAFSIDGQTFAYGETSANLTGTLSYTGTATTVVNVGSYSVTGTGFTSTNYAISYVAGTLSITRAPLTATVNPLSVAYNGFVANGSSATFTYGLTGFVHSETSSVVSGTPAYGGAGSTAVNVGTYSTSLSGLTTTNYAITYVPGALTITPIPLTIVGLSYSRMYGATDPSFSATYTGLAAGDTSGANLASLVASLALTAGTSIASNIGTYTINGTTSTGRLSNYIVSFTPGDLTIANAFLTVTANSFSAVYGAGLTYGATLSGFTAGDSTSTLLTDLALSYSNTGSTHPSVGTYTITAMAGSTTTGPLSNYAISFVTGSLSITPAPLTITANSLSVVYNGSVAYGTSATFGVSYSPFAYGELASNVLSGTLAFGGAATTGMNVNTYAITASGLTNTGVANYSITYVAGNLTIGQAPLTVTANSLSVVYNGSIAYNTSATFSVGYTGILGSDSLSLGTIAYNAGSTTAKNVGTYTITPSGLAGSAASNYSITYVAANLTIGKAPLTVTANSLSVVYDASIAFGGSATFGVTYGGLLGSDTSSAVTGTLAYNSLSTTARNVGTYTITPSGLTSSNYTITTYVAGNLTIGQAPLTVTANSFTEVYNGSIAYGTSATFTVGYTGILGSDSLSLGTIAYNAASTTAKTIGSYTITPSGLSGTNASNYSISYVSGVLSITPAPLTVTVVSQSKTYTAGTFGFTVSDTGFVGGETGTLVLGTPTYSGTAVGAITVGTYTATASGLTAANYTITYVAGHLTIGKAPLTVTAGNLSVVYDGSIAYGGSATFSVTYNALLGSDSLTIGTIAYDATSTTAKNVGTYTITPSGLSGTAASNYTITYHTGKLTIGQAPLTVTANSLSVVYDASIAFGGSATFGVTYGGLLGSDTSSAVTGTLAYNSLSTTARNVGTYVITPSGLTSSNYSISTYVSGNLTIGQAPLTVTANSFTEVYNGSIAYGTSATFTVGYTGILGSDSLSLGTIAYNAASTTAKTIGSYTITPSGLSGTNASNYSISYVSGVLSITPASLTVTVVSQSKTYTAGTFGFTVSDTGFVGGETSAVVTGTPTYSGTAAGAINVGTYSATASGLTAANYTISYVAGNLTIGQAPLTVTANSLSVVYDGSIAYGGSATFGVGYSGFVGGETATVLGGTVAYDSGSTTAKNAGSYTITPSGLTSSNYAITYHTGTLTIGQAPLTVTANSLSVVYDGSIAYGGSATFGVGYAGFVGGETATVLGGTVAYDAGSTTAKNAGSYTITPSGLTSSNYSITYVSGSLSIGQAPLTVTANSLSVVYDGSIAYGGSATFGVAYAGLLGSDTSSAVIGTVAYDSGSTTAKNAGSYTITPSGLTASNYAISYVSGSLSIGQAPLTVTANSLSVVYDGSIAYGGSATFGVGYAGFVGGETATALGGTIAYDSGSTTAKNAGSYTITPSGLTSSNYAISYVSGSLSIGQAPLTVTANSLSVVYDGSIAYGGSATFGVGYAGFVGGETATALGGTVAYDSGSTTAKNAGSYTITPSGLTSSNYAITYQSGTLTIGQAPLTVTANSLSVVYDGSIAYGGSATFGVGYAGFVGGETATALGGTVAYDSGSTTAKNAGSYTITPSGLTSSNYSITYVNGALSIGQAPLTVTANSLSVVYDGSIAYGGSATFGVGYAGFVGGETATALGGTVAYDSGSTTAKNAGSYTITPSGLTSSNYSISYVSGSLSIGQAPLTVTANSLSVVYDGSIAYGGSATFGVGYAGFVGGETATVLGGTVAYDAGSTTAKNAGSYTITPSGLTSSNYSISYVSGSLSIGQAPLTVTANTLSVVYDGSIAYGGSATFGVAYAGLLGSDTSSAVIGTVAYDSGSTTAKNAGSYTITPSGLTASNYAISYVSGSLSIGQAPLTVTANSLSVVYDGSIAYGGSATFGVGYAGFVGGETATALGGTVAYDSGSTTAKNAGSYTITPSGLTSSNYAISYVSGSLSIGQAPLTVTANSLSVVYDGSIAYGGSATFGVGYAGFVGGETATALGGTVAYDSGSTTAKNAGSYTITPSGLTSSNYAITYQTGSLSIGQAPLTVTANSLSVVYDGSIAYGGSATFGVGYAGFVGGETATALGGTVAYDSGSTTAKNAGSYTITPSGLTSSNYSISYVSGSLSIGQAPLTVTANSLSVVYDGSIAYGGSATFGVAYAGLLGSDTSSAVTGTVAYDSGSTTAKNAGSYTITPSGLTSSNYAISYVSGSLSIGQAPLTVTANSLSVVYDGSIAYGGSATFGVGYAGFVGGETATALGGTVAYDTGSTTAKNAGSYTITPSGLTSSNYAITYVNGALSIGQAPLTVTANTLSVVYDGSIAYGGSATFGVGYAGFVGGETATALGGTVAYDTGSTTAKNAGSYTITPSGLTSSNYSITYQTGSLSIGQTPLTVTANSLSVVYDGSIAYGGSATFGVGYAGFVGGETATALGGTVAYDSGSTTAKNAGSYTITPSGLTSSNYAISYVSGSLSIGQAPLTVTANSLSVVYDGSAAFGTSATFGVAYSGIQGGDAGSLGSVSYDPTSRSAHNVGSYTITPSGLSGSAASNYAISYVSGSLSITQAPLTVTANTLSVVYDGSIAYGGSATFGVAYAGLLGSDTSSAVTGTVAYDSGSTTAKNAGSYTITPSGLAASNYSISYVSGSLSIAQAPLTVTANSLSVVYDGSIAFGGSATFGVSYSGLLGSDTMPTVGGVVAYNTGSTTAKNAGSYVITPSGLSTSGASNYVVSYVSGLLSIGQAPLTVTANTLSVVYDGSIAYGGSATFGVAYAGVLGSDQGALGTIAYDTGSTHAQNAGSYTITPSGLNGSAASNYAISYVSGLLSIGQAPLTVTANSLSVVYDGSIAYGGSATFGVAYAGLLGSDTGSSIGGAVAYDSGSTHAQNAGSYTITPSGLTAANYAVTYVSGSLSIGQAPLTVTANSLSVVYDGSIAYGGSATFGVTYSGLLGSDTSSAVTGPVAYDTNSTHAQNAGSYTITPSGLTAANYSISYAPGSLSIGQAPLTVTANSLSVAYNGLVADGSSATFGYGVSGLVGGESASVLHGTANYAGTATSAVNVGSYPITVGGLDAANYAISYAPGSLSISPIPLTIAVSSTSRLYGGTDPSFGATFTGVAVGDTTSGLMDSLGLTRVSGSSVGLYTISGSTTAGQLSNYIVSLAPGQLSIVPAPLTLDPGSASRFYGDANPALSATLIGATGGDSAAALLAAITLSTPATTTSNVGSYTISGTPGSNASLFSNYTLVLNTGELDVVPRPLVLTASNGSVVYGSANPSFTYAVAGLVNGDQIVTAPTLSTDRLATSNVGGYTISIASGSAGSNYVLASYVPGLLTVTPAQLNVAIPSASRVYGTDNPALTALIQGITGADDFASLLSDLQIATAATSASNVGSYAIAAGSTVTGALANYTVNVQSGTLGITPATLTYVAAQTSRTYGIGNGTLGGDVTGFVLNQTLATATTGAVDFSSVATASSGVGTYSVAGSGLSANAGNYIFIQAPPNATALTVTPATATVTAENATRIFGTPNPNFVWDISGLVNGDAAAVITGISASSIANATSGPTTYPILAAGGVAVNYDLVYVPGVLTVTPQITTTVMPPTLNNTGVPSAGLPTTIVTPTFVNFVQSETQSGAISGSGDASDAVAGAPAGAALEVAQSFGKFDIVYRQAAELSKTHEEAVVAVISAPPAADDPDGASTPMITSSYTEANTAPGATNRIELSKTDADTRTQNDNGNARAAGSSGQ